MANLRAAVAIIEQASSEPQKPRQRGSYLAWAKVCIVIGGALLYIAFFLYSVSKLEAAWRTGDSLSWNIFWRNPLYYLYFYPAAFLARKDMLSNPFELWDRIAVARQAALADDGAQVPLAEQPTPDADDSPAITHRILTPLVRPSRARDYGTGAIAACLLVTGFTVAFMAFIAFFVWIGGFNPGAGLALVILTTITACCIAAGYVLLRWCRRTNKPISISVDEHGLRWRESTGIHRMRYIAWSQAQAFWTFSWRSDNTYTNYQIFALVAPHAVFTWQTTQRATREEKQAHAELAGLIAARAGLPLRNLTSALEAAIKPLAAPAKPKMRFPLGKPGTPDAVPGIPAVIATPEPPDVAARARRRRVGLFALSAMTVVPLLLLDGAGFYLQREQPHYFATYLSSAETQPALYLDALNEDDGDWSIQHGTSSNPGDFFFTEDAPLHGVYQLSGPDPQSDMYAWPSQSFSDAVVEVTARQLHNATDGVAGGVGLILRVSGEGDQFDMFQVLPSGRWALWSAILSSDATGIDQTNYNVIDDGSSSAIHQGVGATNRLAVLMHGNDLLLYANGAFLANETDSSILGSGGAGVYVDSQAAGGQFYDFAVYPLPASPPPLWG